MRSMLIQSLAYQGIFFFQFLNRVAEIQEQVAKEELADLEAEKSNLKKKSARQRKS